VAIALVPCGEAVVEVDAGSAVTSPVTRAMSIESRAPNEAEIELPFD
jgi:hypothetical protein